MRLCHPVLAAPLLAASLAIATLPGCASAPPVVAEQAADADVGAYPSFAFFEPFDFEREGYGTLAGERARAVLRREMEARGYRLDPENPALRINLIAAPAERRRASKFSLGLGVGIGGGSTRGGLGVGIPLGGAGARPDSRQPGALSIDVVDAAARRVVWTGSVEVMRTGRDGEREAFESALVRVMAAMPRRGGATDR